MNSLLITKQQTSACCNTDDWNSYNYFNKIHLCSFYKLISNSVVFNHFSLQAYSILLEKWYYLTVLIVCPTIYFFQRMSFDRTKFPTRICTEIQFVCILGQRCKTVTTRTANSVSTSTVCSQNKNTLYIEKEPNHLYIIE